MPSTSPSSKISRQFDAGPTKIEFTPEAGGAPKVLVGPNPSRPGAIRVEDVPPARDAIGGRWFSMLRDSVERGARERLIPILITAMAAGLALIPLAFGGGKAGSEIQTTMAFVILCGLMSSTRLNMVVVPTMYLRYGRPGTLASSQENEM